tara:strand:+ start:6249 stop:7556 length:1308 start_codon:yes stop_codon:yes gene_type:complete
MALTQVSTGGIKDGQVQTADLADAQITAAKLHADALDRTYTLGADGSNHYTFTGEGLTGAVNDPTLYLTRGKTYRFVNGNSSGAHPFRIQTTVNGSAGTEYNTGVTNNGGAGGSTIIFEVPHDAPDVLYYQCTSHGSMGGIFYVTGALADGTVTTAKLAADAVTGAKIADDAIDSEHFVDGSIDTAHIGTGAVTNGKLAADAVTTAKIANSAVTNSKLGDDCVTGSRIADDAINSEHYVDGSIDTAHIADSAVTDAKIASGISASKLTGALPAISGAALTGLSAGAFSSFAIIGDQKGTNTDGGSSTSGAFYTRDLNTEFADDDNIVSISSNQFTLQAGTYLIKASAPAYKASRHQILIWNATDSTGAVGTSEYCGSGESVQSRSFAVARFTIGAAKAFEIRHRVGNSLSQYGLGIAANYDLLNSIYTVVEIYKE